MKKLIASTVLAGGFFAFAGAAHAQCGDISIAEMSWASAAVAAHVDRIILEKGYGCKVTLIAGDTLPTFTSMNEKGEPDIAPEFWVNSVRTALDSALADGRLIRGAKILSEGAIEGWWIPKFLADAHSDIKTVQDALKHPELFPAPDDPDKGAVHNCPKGWSCEISTDNLFRALAADTAGFELVASASAADLDASIARAFETRTGWLGYYWAPTPLLGKYEMTKLSFGTGHDKDEWTRCTAVPDCAAPRVNAYPVSDAYTIVTRQFSIKADVAMGYIKTRKWDNQTIGSVLAWMTDNNSDADGAARYFLETYPDVWTNWVKGDIADRIKAAL